MKVWYNVYGYFVNIIRCVVDDSINCISW